VCDFSPTVMVVSFSGKSDTLGLETTSLNLAIRFQLFGYVVLSYPILD